MIDCSCLVCARFVLYEYTRLYITSIEIRTLICRFACMHTRSRSSSFADCICVLELNLVLNSFACIYAPILNWKVIVLESWVVIFFASLEWPKRLRAHSPRPIIRVQSEYETFKHTKQNSSDIPIAWQMVTSSAVLACGGCKRVYCAHTIEDHWNCTLTDENLLTRNKATRLVLRACRKFNVFAMLRNGICSHPSWNFVTKQRAPWARPSGAMIYKCGRLKSTSSSSTLCLRAAAGDRKRLLNGIFQERKRIHN